VAECLGEFETEFENILGVNQGLGAVDFWKKNKVENLVRRSL
jgi:hypothetical protein